jgi:F-type H+-transporting ATPase subunit epsilon
MLEVIVATPGKVIFEGTARSVVLPGEQGVFELLSYHKPFLSRLISGKMIIDEQEFSIRRGVIGFNQNRATIVIEE